MTERLKILIKKLLPNIRVEFQNPKECYDWFVKFFGNRKEFFPDLQPEELLKIVFYTYSLKKFGSFDWAESVSNNLEFIRILYTELNPHQETCDDCSGDGRTECSECDGAGRINCDECDGDGRVTCSECDGEGEIAGEGGAMETCDMCDGDGEVDCDECESEGRVDCEYCNGGEVYCNSCDGNGEVESDTHVEYQYILYCSWSKILNEKCELEQNTPNPVSENGDIITQNDDVIELSAEDHILEPRGFIEEGEYYCVWIDDSPNLNFNWKMQIDTKTTPGELDVYGQR